MLFNLKGNWRFSQLFSSGSLVPIGAVDLLSTHREQILRKNFFKNRIPVPTDTALYIIVSYAFIFYESLLLIETTEKYDFWFNIQIFLFPYSILRQNFLLTKQLFLISYIFYFVIKF